MRVFLITLVIFLFANNVASSSELSATRVWGGSCPSDETTGDTTRSALALGLVNLIGSKLIDSAIGGLTSALATAGQDKVETLSASLNISDLNKFPECLVIISGQFYGSKVVLDQSGKKEILFADSKKKIDEKVVKRIIRNLTNSNIYLASDPNLYLEFRVNAKNSQAISLTPVVIAYKKSTLNNTFFGSSKRDVVISFALSSTKTESNLASGFVFKDWQPPIYSYFDFSSNQTASSKLNSNRQGQTDSKTTNSNDLPDAPGIEENVDNVSSDAFSLDDLLTGGWESPWLLVPDGSGPWKLSVAFSETREGNAFLKALGSAISAEQTKIAEITKQAIFKSEKEAAEAKSRDIQIQEEEKLNSNIQAALVAHTDASNLYAACNNLNADTKPNEADKAINDYLAARKLALTAYLKAGNPIEFKVDRIPMVNTCPPPNK